ncbi:hypothetical protein RF11_13338 [Thelohanellus kitauei]|uniref:Uncharacterized protein n=1 Tax=Thelohanellus kitauei TaxID=669202 RepID=A0A0C2NDN0_THEKT|nr:hypothetical protein RF11_13338 [Thelohanellus kitauei]
MMETYTMLHTLRGSNLNSFKCLYQNKMFEIKMMKKLNEPPTEPILSLRSLTYESTKNSHDQWYEATPTNHHSTLTEIATHRLRTVSVTHSITLMQMYFFFLG